MATNTTNEEIVEKRDRSRLAAACLIVSFLAVAGAIALQLMEISEVRAGFTRDELRRGKVERVDKEISDLGSRIAKVLEGSEISEAERRKLEENLEGGAAPGAGAAAPGAASESTTPEPETLPDF